MNKKEKKKIMILFAAMLAALVAFGFVMLLYAREMPEEIIADSGFLTEKPSQEGKEEVRGTVTIKGKQFNYFHEYETYLLMGLDESGSQSGETYQGSMSDFLLLAVLDRTENSVSFLPINRDTMTEITLLQEDGTGEASAELQLCTAHWYGGNEEQSCNNTVEAVSHLLGNIPIDRYYCLPMSAIPKLNCAVGGVEVTLLEDFTKIDKNMKKGKTIMLSDSQAYHYVHDRYGIGDEENISRMKRQRQYMQSLFGKIKNQAKADKTFINTIFRELEGIAVTNIKGEKLSVFMKIMLHGESKGFYELEGTAKLGQALGDGKKHVEFYVDEDSLLNVMKELYGLEKRNGD